MPFIEAEGFKASSAKKSWLGEGIYFFQGPGAFPHAKEWAKMRSKPERGAVYQAEIKLGRCLDLQDPDAQALVEETVGGFSAGGMEVTEPSVVNFLAKRFSADTVRAIEVKPRRGKLFGQSQFLRYARIILCVRNADNILGYTLAWQDLGNA